jgi:hypothetical protein
MDYPLYLAVPSEAYHGVLQRMGMSTIIECSSGPASSLNPYLSIALHTLFKISKKLASLQKLLDK